MTDGPDLTRDAFLGGQVQAWQPRDGFRSGIDAVLLAAAVPAASGDKVLELGCGAAVASLCLAARVPGVQLHGLEIQPEYVALAEQNADAVSADIMIYQGDVLAPPQSLRQISFDHVMMNPPYFDRASGSASDNPGRDVARGGSTPLMGWIDTAIRRLRPGGALTLIQRISELPHVLAAFDDRLGAVQVVPLVPRVGRTPDLFLSRAIKGRRSPFELCMPIILHKGSRHGDADDGYSTEIEGVLRGCQPLNAFVS